MIQTAAPAARPRRPRSRATLGGRCRRALLGAAGLMLGALGLAGCGIGIGPNHAGKQVSVRVSTGFGGHVLATHDTNQVPAHESDLAFTGRFFTLKTSDGGGFVDAIDGHGDDAARKLDWFYYVNGIEAPKGAAATELHPGDHVWWDLHDWSATEDVPAVVGSYPEPFTNGNGGQAYPTTVTCAAGLGRACDAVTHSLGRAGVKVSFQALGTGSGSDSLAVVVGTYAQLRGVIAAELLQGGPAKSGVYAQFVGSQGQEIELDGPSGNVVDTLSGSAGLIAAIEQPGLNEPVWLVTGTDAAGVDAAAAALTPAKLANHFAVAVTGGTHVVSLPRISGG